MNKQDEWTTARIGDIARVISGYAFKSSEFGNTGIPVIKIKNIRLGYVDLSDTEFVSEQYLSLDQRFHVKGGDILISLTGSHVTQPNSIVGRVAIYSDNLPASLLNQRAGKVLITRSDLCDPVFLYYVLSNKKMMRSIASLAHGAASQANVSPRDIESLEITLPKLDLQKRIGASLRAYDLLIENNNRRITILDQLSEMLYREWFVRFQFPLDGSVERPSYTDGQIPKGWTWSTLGDVSINFDRLRKPLSKQQREAIPGPFPYYGAAKVLDHVNDYLFDGRYLLIAEDGTVISSTGTPVLQLADGQFWVNNHTHILQGRSPITTEFLFLCLRDYKIAGHITGAAQPKITQENLNRIPVLIPEERLLLKFTAMVKPLIDLGFRLAKQNQCLQQMREELQPILVSGTNNIYPSVGANDLVGALT